MEHKDISIKENAFDVIRYFAAFSVMGLHYTYYAITLSEQPSNALRLMRRITELMPGVIILFSLSGFLIAASFERCKNRKEFFVKRILRLYPELWVCTLVNLLVIMLFARDYLDNSIWIWLLTQVIGVANTPSCLKEFATGSVNGALWTVFTEVQMYIILGFGYKIIKKFNQFGWGLLLFSSAIINLICNTVSLKYGGICAKLIERSCFPYLLWFLIGVFCYRKKELILPIIKKYMWIFLLIFVTNQIWEWCTWGYYEDIVTGILLPFITIGAAYMLPAVRIKCDLSYGIFLYHWIVLNVFVHLELFMKFQWYVCSFIFVVVTLVAAWLSRCFVAGRIKF